MEECHIYEAFRQGHGTHIDDEVLWRRDGSSFSAEYWSRPIHRHGKVIGTVVTFVDITERKRAEEQTRLQTAALESAANGIAIADRRGPHPLGQPRLYPLDRLFADRDSRPNHAVPQVGGAGFAHFYRNLWQTILAGKVWQGELVNRRKDGTVYTDDTTITPVHDASGGITHFVAIKQDVTEREQAEQALEERTVYLNTLFEISPMGIVVLDSRGAFRCPTRRLKSSSAIRAQEIMGAKLDDFIVPQELAAEARTLTALCLGGPGAQLTSRRRRKDGTLVDVDIYGVPLVIERRIARLPGPVSGHHGAQAGGSRPGQVCGGPGSLQSRPGGTRAGTGAPGGGIGPGARSAGHGYG